MDAKSLTFHGGTSVYSFSTFVVMRDWTGSSNHDSTGSPFRPDDWAPRAAVLDRELHCLPRRQLARCGTRHAESLRAFEETDGPMLATRRP